MMRVDDVREHLDKRPFEPFRLCFSDASSVEVMHPELCWLARSSAHVAVPDLRVRGRALRVLHCALVHIVRFEPLNGGRRGSARRKNGRAR
jgi:hypothetical protein